MYAINPIFDKSKVQVDTPTCMYKMKPVYDELQSGATSLTNGLDGAVSHHKSISPPLEILQQIGNVLKVLVPSVHTSRITHSNENSMVEMQQSQPQSTQAKDNCLLLVTSIQICIVQHHQISY